MPHFGLVLFRYLKDHRQNVYLFNTAAGTLIRESQVVLGLLKAQQKAHKQIQQSLLCTFLLFDVRLLKKYGICRLLIYRVWKGPEMPPKSVYIHKTMTFIDDYSSHTQKYYVHR